MEVKLGEGKTEFGTGVDITLSADELAMAVMSYLYSHQVYIEGPRTVRVNGEPCQGASVYVDPMGFVMYDGKRYSGRGEIQP